VRKGYERIVEGLKTYEKFCSDQSSKENDRVLINQAIWVFADSIRNCSNDILMSLEVSLFLESFRIRKLSSFPFYESMIDSVYLNHHSVLSDESVMIKVNGSSFVLPLLLIIRTLFEKGECNSLIFIDPIERGRNQAINFFKSVLPKPLRIITTQSEFVRSFNQNLPFVFAILSPENVFNILTLIDQQILFRKTRFCITNITKRMLNIDVLVSLLTVIIRDPLPCHVSTLSGIPSWHLSHHFQVKHEKRSSLSEFVIGPCEAIMSLLPSLRGSTGNMMCILPSPEDCRQVIARLMNQSLPEHMSFAQPESNCNQVAKEASSHPNHTFILPILLDSEIHDPELPQNVVKLFFVVDFLESILHLSHIIDVGVTLVSDFASHWRSHKMIHIQTPDIIIQARHQILGRTCEGTYVQYEGGRPFTPEICRADLTAAMLNFRKYGINLECLPLFPGHPGAQTINDALSQLVSVGALDESGSLTKKGRQLADLACPGVPVFLTEAIIEFHKYIDKTRLSNMFCLIVVLIMSSSTIFCQFQGRNNW
jgi:hypothetical protein